MEEGPEQQKHYGQGNELIAGIYSMPLDCKRMLLLGLAKVRHQGSGIKRPVSTVPDSSKDMG